MSRLILIWSLILALGIALPALAWDSRDVEAADRYRALERERAERYRDEVERGRVARVERSSPAPRTTSRKRPGRDRQAERRERNRSRERSGRPNAWDREVDRWADQIEVWGEELRTDLGDAIEDAVREALGGKERR